MPAQKHSYAITINRTPSKKAERYTYTFGPTRCTIAAGQGNAQVTFEMGVLRGHEDVVSFRLPPAKDAMRKMYLLHAMKFSTSLHAKRITVTIDGQEQTYLPTYPSFPFLRSMLVGSNYGLPGSWQDRDFLTAVLDRTKSESENDLRFVCLFSFLSGLGKQFEIDRFTCYWTAMNAHYNYLEQCYNAHPGHQKTLNGDGPGIGALLRVLDCGEKKTARPDVQANRTQYGAIKNYLRGIPREELPGLCAQLRAHRTDRGYFPAGGLGAHLKKCCDRTHLTAYGFLLLDYAYYIRCNYLHGSKVTPLFATEQDQDLAAFRTLNILLGDYLKEAIPQMFTPIGSPNRCVTPSTGACAESIPDILEKPLSQMG